MIENHAGRRPFRSSPKIPNFWTSCSVTWFSPGSPAAGARGRVDKVPPPRLTPDLVLTAAHCVVRNVDYQVMAYQAGGPIPVRTIARHPRFDYASYAASR